MRRRRFLGSAGALAGLAAAPLARAAVAAADPPRFHLLVAREAKAGTPFVPLALSMCEACAAPVMEIAIEGLREGASLEAFDRLEVRALFGANDATAVPFVAWRYAAGPVPSRTDSARFIAGRDVLRRLEIGYRLAGEPSGRLESCRIDHRDAAGLAPGHYVLAFARSADAPPASGLVHSGDERAPLAGPAARHFGGLAIRIAPAA